MGLSFQIQTVPGKPGRTGHPTLPFHTYCSCVHLHCQRPAPVYPCWRAALRLLMSPNLVPPPPEPEVTESLHIPAGALNQCPKGKGVSVLPSATLMGTILSYELPCLQSSLQDWVILILHGPLLGITYLLGYLPFTSPLAHATAICLLRTHPNKF